MKKITRSVIKKIENFSLNGKITDFKMKEES